MTMGVLAVRPRLVVFSSQISLGALSALSLARHWIAVSRAHQGRSRDLHQDKNQPDILACPGVQRWRETILSAAWFHRGGRRRKLLQKDYSARGLDIGESRRGTYGQSAEMRSGG